MLKKIIITAVILIIVIGAGFLIYQFLAPTPQKESVGGEIYTNPVYGYSITLPENWKGKYFVEEKYRLTSFVYNSSSELKHNLFSIVVYTNEEWQRLKNEPGYHGNEIASKDNLVFVSVFSLDNPYTGAEGDEYQKMAGDINKIINTFEFKQTSISIEDECAKKLALQREVLEKDTLAETETFEKYPVKDILQTKLADLDVRSNKFANEFRTKIREELASKGVNFAGSYSLISVRMTGWGDNYFIIDRKTGYAYLFPYYAAFLEFRKDSNLIIMNPKKFIVDLINERGCFFLEQQFSADLRPFYFLWQDNQLILIGPKDITPLLNKFWSGYF